MFDAVVNVDKSIQRKRLVYKVTVGTFLDYFFTYFLGSAVIILCLGPNFTDKNPTPPIILIIISCAVALWMIANLILLNGLVKFKGKDLNTNRKDINSVLNTYYDSNTVITTDRLIRSVKSTKGFSFGNIVSIILDDEMVYLNITTLGKDDMPSPFSGLYNYVRCRGIAKIIKSHQNQID